MAIKILFFHFDLGNGGAEKVLVNLANNLDPEKYDITVKTLFNYGENKDTLNSNIHREWVLDKKPFRGVTKMLRLFSPRLLHRLFVKDSYDVEVAFLEGTPARIVSGCPNCSTRKYAWIHVEIGEKKQFFGSFRNMNEASICYHKFNGIACVSEYTMKRFVDVTGWNDLPISVVHNVLEVDKIIRESHAAIPLSLNPSELNICSVGRLNTQKGYDRLLRVLGALNNEGIADWHLYLMGQGEEKKNLETIAAECSICEKVTFLGYVQPPYPYVSKMDLFVCSSRREGFSTAVSEAIIVGTPVITTLCSGMEEILGKDGGVIVENSEQGLFEGLKQLLTDRSLIIKNREKAIKRSSIFSTRSAIKEFENFIHE